jgi:hypothetical protein
VRYRTGNEPPLSGDVVASQQTIPNQIARHGVAGFNSQGTPPPHGGLSPGLAFEGSGPDAKVVPRSVLLVQRAPSVSENATLPTKPGRVKLWAVRSPGGPEVLLTQEGTYERAARPHNHPGWHPRACIDYLHALATMLFCLHGPEAQPLLMAPFREVFCLTDVEEYVLNRLVPLTREPKVPRCDPSGKPSKNSSVFEKTVLDLTKAAKNQDPWGFPAGWKERLPSVLHSDWRDHLPVSAEEDAPPEPSAASEDRPTAVEAEASDRDLDPGCPATPPTVGNHTNKSRPDLGTVPRNDQGGKSASGASASTSTLSWDDVASSSDASSRPATSPSRRDAARKPVARGGFARQARGQRKGLCGHDDVCRRQPGRDVRGPSLSVE